MSMVAPTRPVSQGFGRRFTSTSNLRFYQGISPCKTAGMTASRPDLLDDLQRFVRSRGIDVGTRQMDVEKPGEFDGPTITLNPVHDREALCFYLAHAVGSIYQWSTDFEHSQKVFDELREAKAKRRQDRSRFLIAVDEWRLFEQTSSDHAVWALDHIGHADAIPPYTVFFRADIEAMTIFHRTGKEPRWPDFFADWTRKAASGAIHIAPFQPREIRPFRPRIQKQEVLQEHD